MTVAWHHNALLWRCRCIVAVPNILLNSPSRHDWCRRQFTLVSIDQAGSLLLLFFFAKILQSTSGGLRLYEVPGKLEKASFLHIYTWASEGFFRRDFSKIFPGGAKNGNFFPLELRKQPFMKFSKSRGPWH